MLFVLFDLEVSPKDVLVWPCGLVQWPWHCHRWRRRGLRCAEGEWKRWSRWTPWQSGQ